MTYKHKLARRIARLRVAAMFVSLAFAVACSSGELTTPIDGGDSPVTPSALLSIAPRRVTLEAHQPAAFVAYNRGSSQADSVATAVEWTATGGTIGTDGVFTSAATGEFRVIGRRKNPAGTPMADTAVVTIVVPQPSLARINVTPNATTLQPGAQQAFTVTGTRSDGATVPVGAVWSATGGTIDAAGTFTAGTAPGAYRVIAKAASANVADTVAITITAGATATLQSIALSPATVTLAPGESKAFTVQGRMSDGSTTAISTATFSATGGSIDGSGKYTAGSTAGTYQVTAHASNAAGADLSATASVSISAAAPSPGASTYPNQPSGFSRITELAASSLMPNQTVSCSGYGILAGCWQRWSNMLAVKSDPTAPQSPSSVLEYTWPAGLPIGNSAGSFNGWDGTSGGNLSRTEYSQTYESGWIKLDGSSFEAPDAGMKLLGFWGVGQGRDWNKVANQIYSMIPGGTRSSFTLDIRQQGQVSRSMGQNQNGSPLIVVGRWVRYEIYMKLNDIGRANGILKVWINGTLTHDYRDVTWRTSAAPSGFFGRRWDPTWGGMGNPSTKRKTDRMLVDHVYISGVR
ncbi:MAG TPA: hypothetical protein VFS33_10575 [Gemmatimonadales bacterium]|nr:hypothetical protein [Gemmatimonadales bacterium]